MQRIKEAKVLNILAIKDRGIGPAEAVRILSYGRSTVKAVYSGNYELIPFMPLEEWNYKEKMTETSKGPAVWVTKNDYDLKDVDSMGLSFEDPVNSCIRKEEAEQLYSVLDTLSARDRKIIQAKADGLSNRQIQKEFKTKPSHIRTIQKKLQKQLEERS